VSRENTWFGKIVVVACVVAGSGLGVTRNAHATLGGDVASIAADAQRMVGARRVEKLPSGERHVLELPSGLVVHEYVSATGAVYAVSWSGRTMPDLRELLGPYFAQLSRADAHRGGHHRMSLVGSDLVIRSSGHRGSFSGRAWVPSLVPADVDVLTQVQ
jgi:hypothetical protein